MLSGLQEECLMGCLLHFLCESALPNIKMQRTGADSIEHLPIDVPAADLERSIGQTHKIS